MRIHNQQVIEFFINLLNSSPDFNYVNMAGTPKLAISENKKHAVIYLSYYSVRKENKELYDRFEKMLFYFYKENGKWIVSKTISALPFISYYNSIDITNDGNEVCLSSMYDNKTYLLLINIADKELINNTDISIEDTETLLGTNVLYSKNGNIILVSGIKIQDNVNLSCYTRNEKGVFEINNSLIPIDVIQNQLFSKSISSGMSMFGGSPFSANSDDSLISEFIGLTIEDLSSIMKKIES